MFKRTKTTNPNLPLAGLLAVLTLALPLMAWSQTKQGEQQEKGKKADKGQPPKPENNNQGGCQGLGCPDDSPSHELSLASGKKGFSIKKNNENAWFATTDDCNGVFHLIVSFKAKLITNGDWELRYRPDSQKSVVSADFDERFMMFHKPFMMNFLNGKATTDPNAKSDWVIKKPMRSNRLFLDLWKTGESKSRKTITVDFSCKPAKQDTQEVRPQNKSSID